MAAITLSIGVATCAKFVVEYLGLIESAATNTSRLRHASLKNAIAWFNNAKNCTDPKTMEVYLNDARREFMNAVNLEENENKIAAFLGLSMCQRMLGDNANAEDNINMIKMVFLSDLEVIKRVYAEAFASGGILVDPPLPIVPMIELGKYLSVPFSSRRRRAVRESFEEYKTKALNFDKTIVTQLYIHE